jgi:hypothetical protein
VAAVSDNKALVTINIDGKNRKFGVRDEMRLALEMNVEDEHDREVAMIEIRRQPDNEITVKIYGRGTEPLFEQVVRRGKDRRRADHGYPSKLPVADIPVAKGAP